MNTTGARVGEALDLLSKLPCFHTANTLGLLLRTQASSPPFSPHQLVPSETDDGEHPSDRKLTSEAVVVMTKCAVLDSRHHARDIKALSSCEME